MGNNHLHVSRYNLLEPLEVPVDSFTHVVLNSFCGSIDLLDEHAARILRDGAGLGPDARYASIIGFLKKRGYIFDSPAAEQDKVESSVRAAGSAYLKDTLLFVVIPTYACNLNCSYCFQGTGANRPAGFMSEGQMLKCLRIITRLAREKNKPKAYVDLIGGEPLLPNSGSKKFVGAFMRECTARNIWVNVVTNGTFLDEYCDILRGKNIQYVQVTLDGPPAHHNRARPGKNIDSFSRIINSVRAALDLGIPIAVRTNVSFDSVDGMSELVDIYEKNGFLKYDTFFPYLQPIKDNSCLSCAPAEEEDAILDKVLDLCAEDPRLAATFSLNNFAAFRYVIKAFKSKRAPVPRFWRCEANIGQYVFDSGGDIYACLEAAGNPAYRIGRYDPAFCLDAESLARWRGRNVFDIEQCRNCCVSFICAGGCTWHNCSRDMDFLSANCSEKVEESVRLLLRKYAHEFIKTGEDKGDIFNMLWKKLRR